MAVIHPATNVLASAYVAPVRLTGSDGDIKNNSIFSANVPNLHNYNEVDRRSLFVDYDLTAGNTNDQFWTIFLLGAYQSILSRDNDPYTEPQVKGVVDAITGDTSDGSDGEGSGVLIFLELNRSKEIEGYNAFPERQVKTTVAHEVGHLFGCQHGEGDLMGDDEDGNPVTLKFSAISIDRIRSISHP